MGNDYTITFACYNQLSYTQRFIESLRGDAVDFSRIVAVDNGSTDGTQQWLLAQGFGRVIINRSNLGCGVAWNQGALANQSEWTIVMNNDVVCTRGWLEKLIAAAKKQQLQIASPAMIEGALDYDLDLWAQKASDTMSGYCRFDHPHAVCMAIRNDTWKETGYFIPTPKLLGYEDALFFQRAHEAGIKMGTVGESWIHHFGMTTQKALKLEKNLRDKDSLGNRNLMKLYLGQDWLQRKMAKIQRLKKKKRLLKFELAHFKHSVHALNDGDKPQWIWA